MGASLSRRLCCATSDPDGFSQLTDEQLVRQTFDHLWELLTIDRDAEVPLIGELADRAEDESAWFRLVKEILRTSCAHPLSPTLTCLLLDIFALPPPALTEKLSDFVFSSVGEPWKGKGWLSAPSGGAAGDSSSAGSSRDDTRAIQAASMLKNALTVWGVLAEKLVGGGSEKLLSPRVMQMLLWCVRDQPRLPLVLQGLVTIEKFSQTGSNKQRLIDAGVMDALTSLASRMPAHTLALSVASPTPLAQASTATQAAHNVASADLKIMSEIAFCARWLLETMFSRGDGSRLIMPLDPGVNVILSHRDTTDLLKLSPDGLAARNDAITFESVRSTMGVSRGQWYFEVEVVTLGIMQIGWATKLCKMESEEGAGIGDDEESFGYDGCRQVIWHKGRTVRHTHARWAPGDIVGCYIDIENGRILFWLNGCENPVGFANTRLPRGEFYAAASLMSFQQCSFNFGATPFRFPPPVPFSNFNSHGSLSDADTVIAAKAGHLRPVDMADDDHNGPRCDICFDAFPDTILFPCGHGNMCGSCAVQCETCPICRARIRERKQIGIDRRVSVTSASHPAHTHAEASSSSASVPPE